MNSFGVTSSGLSLSGVILALRAMVGRWGGRGVLTGVLGLLLYRRLGEICRRMEGMAARFRAGRVLRRAVRVDVTGGVAVVRGARVRGERVWPLAFGWLVKAAAHEAAVFGGQLRMVLEQPEMQALLVASPQAMRVLRPLCRMLAVETSLLRPGLVVAAEVAPVVKVRVRTARVAVDWGRVLVPRGVLSAVRRGAFCTR